MMVDCGGRTKFVIHPGWRKQLYFGQAEFSKSVYTRERQLACEACQPACEACWLLGGSGGMPPQKIFEK